MFIEEARNYEHPQMNKFLKTRLKSFLLKMPSSGLRQIV